MRRRCARCARR
uniref:Uncharacterized protein n=1 Tax=Arundo donax TaxID=35708 RepID=A0A0A9FK47_ARUDO